MSVFFRPRGVKEGLAAGYVLMRIAEKVKAITGGCWEWQGGGTGYPHIDLKNHSWPERTVAVHRLVYELCVGDVGKSHVLHECDNPRCVNPLHLFIGTNQDNIDDKARKGRQARGVTVRKNHDHVRGEGVGTSKLTTNKVRQIRLRVSRGEKQRAVATDLGLSTSQVCSIVNRKSWAHVD